MSRGVGLSRAGSHAAWVVVSVGAATPRQPWLDLWALAASAVGSAVVSAAASEDVTVDSGAGVVALATADSAVVLVVAAVMVAVVVIALAAPTAAHPTRPADRAAVMVVATTGGMDPEVVGMAVTAAHAHMMTDLVEATATATPGRRAATWSRSGPAARVVGITAAETTTGPETTTTPGSAATRVATKILESCVATNKTILRRLVVGIISSVAPSLSFFSFAWFVSTVRLSRGFFWPSQSIFHQQPGRNSTTTDGQQNSAWDRHPAQGNLVTSTILQSTRPRPCIPYQLVERPTNPFCLRVLVTN